MKVSITNHSKGYAFDLYGERMEVSSNSHVLVYDEDDDLIKQYNLCKGDLLEVVDEGE